MSNRLKQDLLSNRSASLLVVQQQSEAVADIILDIFQGKPVESLLLVILLRVEERIYKKL
ncbi:hypothetical protein WG66_002910 [Moniliophthora roreri]|nr:hypothetical protein WG66_002910 [Moniliophthora roreri]